jgi:hypothetical protein
MLSGFLISCKSSDQNSTTEAISGAYPVISTETSAETNSGYPISDDGLTYNQGPEFTINRPININSSTVSGEGPAGLPIILVDVSEVGEVLAETIIDENGVFTFQLTTPLIQNHIIGIQLGDLTGTNYNEADYQYSDSYFERPLVGILLDMVTVE